MAQKKKRTFTKEQAPDAKSAGSDWRLFLAIPLPDHIRSIVKDLNARLADGDLSLRLVDPQLAHITLHFLGETAPERAELLSLALPAAVSRRRPAQLTTTGLGVFPTERKPRVVWLGLAGDVEPLIAIHAALGNVLRAHQFPTESRSFHPHITLARVRENAPKSIADAVRTVLNSDPVAEIVRREPRSFIVDEIVLMRSHLEKKGPRYETITTLKLRERS